MIKCGQCKYWRFKSSGADDKAFGICDNKTLFPLLKGYMAVGTIYPDDIRFEENFGCIFAEGLEE